MSDNETRHILGYHGKMVSGFVLILALIIVFIAISTYNQKQQQQRLQTISSLHMKKLDLVYRLRHHARERTVHLLRMYPMQDVIDIDSTWEKFMQHGTEFLVYREQLLQTGLNEYEQHLLDRQRDISRIAQPLQQRIVELIKQDQRQQALDSIDKLFEAQDGVLEILQQLATYQKQVTEEAVRAHAVSNWQSRKLMWLIAALVLIIAMVIAINVIRRTVLHDKERNAYLQRAERSNALLQKSLIDLEKARDQALLANESKGQFLAKMSHELRTPLNAVIGLSDLTLDVAQENQYQDIIPDLEQIKNSGGHLLSLINDVLDLAKVESGKEELFISETDVGNLAQEVISLIRPLAITNDNDLRCEIDVQHKLIYTDARKLRQILINLLGNAIKFTKNGYIYLSISQQTVQQEVVYQFSVRDTGRGMSPTQLKRIFEPFEQAAQDDNTIQPGTGLGLTLTYRFCKLLGTRLEVDSRPGLGSVFSFTLPGNIAKLETATPPETHADGADAA